MSDIAPPESTVDGNSKKPMLPPAWKASELAADDPGQRRTPHWLAATIILIAVAAVTWAAFADIDEIARGEGRVIVASQIQLVQNLEGGIVSSIQVKEGDAVRQGQILFQLDDVRFSSAFREGAQGMWGLKAKVARLSAEVAAKPPAMPADVLKEAPALAANEMAVYRARQTDLAGKIAVTREQMTQRTQEVVELESKRDRTQEQLDLLRKEINITAPLVSKGAVSEVEMLRLERDSARLRTELEAAIHAIPRVRASVEEAKRRLDDNENQFRGLAAAELSQARNELAKVTESVPGLEDRLTRTAVRSPVNGIVKTVTNKTPGGVVQPGTPMAEIVPVEDSLIVETRIRPQDIGFVSVGQRAVVKLAAYDFSIYGGLDGTVDMVSADSIQPQASGGAPQEPYYIAHVRTVRSAIDFHGKILPVIPGMTGQVDVLTGRRSVLYYLLKPINKARQKALSER